MYELSEEGELERNLCEDPFIPNYMDSRSYLLLGGQLYAYDLARINWEWAGEVFDRKKWRFL